LASFERGYHHGEKAGQLVVQFCFLIFLLLQGYEVFVIADAVSSRTESNKTIGLMMLQNEGVKLLSTEAALFALLQSAEHPHFKEIAKLVK